MSRALHWLRLIAGALAVAAASHAGAQSVGSAPVPGPKAKARIAFVAAEPIAATELALPPIDVREIEAAKRANTGGRNKRLQIGVARPTFGRPEAEGGALAWTAVDGGRVARWEVVSPGAQALRVELATRVRGMRFEVRYAGSGDPATVYGPFTAESFDGRRFGSWSPVLEGERASIEVFVPQGASIPALAITQVSHLFASPGSANVYAAAALSDTCEVDLICESATDTALARAGNAVARMTFTTPGGPSYLCTGTLLNSTDGSGAPYFYSARHCIGDQETASSLATLWFFDRTGCGTGDTNPAYTQVPGGAQLLYGDPASDVALLQLYELPPAGAWFAGWDAQTLTPGTALTAIHHPGGDVKKVSHGAGGGFGSPGNPPGSFTIVNWASGVTEPGSSGSGIFTAIGSPASDYRMRGGLWGGPSTCSASPSSRYDYYSRLDQAYAAIRQWIDPPSGSAALVVMRDGAGNGSVTSAPAGISCGLNCNLSLPAGTVAKLTAAANPGSRFSGWSGACSGVAPCSVTLNAAKRVTASFATIASEHLLDVGASVIDFGPQSMGATSPPVVVQLTNVGGGAVTFASIAAADAQFAASSDCTVLAPGATCSARVTLKPASQAGPVYSSSPVGSVLSISSDADGSPAQVTLSGVAEKSLVSHFYAAILGRRPDAPGKSYWQGEGARVAGLGGNVNEAWFALAMSFFSSPEYAARGRDDPGFVSDLYGTFFDRAPDDSGATYWTQALHDGLPRGVALAGFMFSPEFIAFTQSIYGNTGVRPEIDSVTDFYRGLLARLPDSDGFGYWLQRFRAAQCQDASAVLAEVDAVSAAFATSPEYAARGRTDSEYVSDLYNAFLRRGGDLAGVDFWIDQLATGARSRERLRKDFIASPEFGARVNAMIAAGCAVPS